MDSKMIILLSSQNDRSSQLISTLKSKDLFVSTVKNIDQATSRLTSSDIFMILIDYISIKEAERNDLKILFANASSTKFVIYDVPDDATRRRAFYRLGTYRILPENYNLEDIVFFCSNAQKKLKQMVN